MGDEGIPSLSSIMPPAAGDVRLWWTLVDPGANPVSAGSEGRRPRLLSGCTRHADVDADMWTCGRLMGPYWPLFIRPRVTLFDRGIQVESHRFLFHPDPPVCQSKSVVVPSESSMSTDLGSLASKKGVDVLHHSVVAGIHLVCGVS
jgi:hypothetical protein